MEDVIGIDFSDPYLKTIKDQGAPIFHQQDSAGLYYKSFSTTKIASALSNAQSDMGFVIKNKSVDIKLKDGRRVKYDYADLSSGIDALRNPFKENALSHSQIISISEKDPSLHVMHTLILHESGEWLHSTVYLGKPESNSSQHIQSFGSVITYMKRYALFALAGIATEDLDGADADIAEISSPLKNNILEKGKFKEPIQPSSLAKTLMSMCAETKVDIEKFGNFHSLKSTEPSTIQKAVDNFDDYLDRYHLYLDSLNKSGEAA